MPSTGIGATIAKELAVEGANVVLAERQLEKLNEVISEITELKWQGVSNCCPGGYVS